MTKSTSLSGSTDYHQLPNLWLSTGRRKLSYFFTTLLFTILLLLSTISHRVMADEVEPKLNNSFISAQSASSVKLHITQFDNSQSPNINISIFSTGLPMDMLRLPIEIVEFTNGDKQIITGFPTYPDYIGARRLIVINHDQLDAVSSNGLKHRVNFESIVREIYDHPTVFTNEDWLSAYMLARPAGATQIIEWNHKKADYFISLVTHPFEFTGTWESSSALPDESETEVAGQTNQVDTAYHLTSQRSLSAEERDRQPPVLANLRAILQRFEMLSPESQAVQSVIIFSDSQQSIVESGRSSVDSLVQYAKQNQIYIHGVHMARQGEDDAIRSNPDLKELVLKTNGIYIYHETQSDLHPLWERLNEEKLRTRLIYQPSSDNVDEIQLRVMLPDGAFATSERYAVDFPAASVQVNQGLDSSIGAALSSTEKRTSTEAPEMESSQSNVGQTRLSTFLPKIPSIVGLADGLIGNSRGLLLILWALCVGLLFFLIFPEIVKGWQKLTSGKAHTASNITASNFNMGESDIARLQSDHGTASVDKQAVRSANFPYADIITSASNGTSPSNGVHIQNGHSGNGHATNGHNGHNYSPSRAINVEPAENDETNIYDAVPKHELGRLVRITYDSTLPPEVPIYQTSQSDMSEISIYIGRTKQKNTVVIPDRKKRISREHAILRLEKGLLYLQDNESVAGTFLNGGKLQSNERKLLRDRDRIGFGSVEYQIQLQSEEPTAVNVKTSMKESVDE